MVGLRGPQLSVQGKRLRLPLTDLGVGILFILLASRLEVARFADVRLLALVAIVMFLLRPAATWLATFGRRYTVREKILIAWIAPRGIVAAALASL